MLESLVSRDIIFIGEDILSQILINGVTGHFGANKTTDKEEEEGVRRDFF